MTEKPTFDKILEITPFACVLMADDYHIKYMNPIMSKFLSLSNVQDLTGLPIMKYIPEKDQADFISFLRELDQPVNEQIWKVFSFIDSDGHEKNILLNGTNNMEQLGASGVYFLVGMPLFDTNLADILPEHIGRKLMDKFSYNKYKSIFESATVGITILDEQKRIDETNSTFAEHLGLSKEDVLNKPYDEIFIGDAKEKIENLHRRIVDGKQTHAKDVVTIYNGKVEHKVLEISLSKIYNDYENLNKFMMLTEDITNQQETHAALLQSEKLALTGRLAASLAHEINNPLQTSIGCLGLVEEMLDDDDQDLRVYITMAMDELERSARIVKKLRDLNRKADESDKTPIDLQKALEDVLILTKNQLYDRNIVPIFPYQGPPPVVMASKDQIRQVFLNLIMNAIDAMRTGGNIYLDFIQTDSPIGIKVKIRDTGIGIDQELMNHLFDPFFTTKEDGLGLGLYICKQIIEDHDGTLSVESKSGIGTEFSIWLPALDVSGKEE